MVEDDLSSWSGLLTLEVTPTLARPENSSVIALAQGDGRDLLERVCVCARAHTYTHVCKWERSARGRCVHLPGVSDPLISIQSPSLLGSELKWEGEMGSERL